MPEHAAHVEREKAVAVVVAKWFGQNPGTLVGWVIEEDGIVATFRCPLTPEEVERYRALVVG